MDYTPSETCEEFMLSNAPIRCIVGPIGSGKSLACIMELFRKAISQKPDARGIRPTRFVIVRNTSHQLRTTVVPDVLAALPHARHRVSTGEILFDFVMDDGTIVESQWLLMALERPEDTRKLLSLNITAAWIEECREIDYDVVAALRGRCSRYPSRARVAPTWGQQPMIMSTNPWSESSAWHEHFVLDRPNSWALFQQPSGISPEAENIEHLEPGYYENLIEGHDEIWVRTHVYGEWGEDQFGMAVFRASFERTEHLVESIKLNPMNHLVLGMDFGRTPATVILQKDFYGRLVCMEEVVSFDMNLPNYLEVMLIPLLHEFYPQMRVFVIGDPAGAYPSQLTDATPFTVLEDYGFQAMPAPSNDPHTRIGAVERALLARRHGKPGLMIVEGKCPALSKAMLRDYRYKKQRSGELTPLPEKNDASHVSDALQYGVLGFDSPILARQISRFMQPKMERRPRFDRRAWT